jgi:hypothetical protein
MINMKRPLTMGIILVLLLACIGVVSANLVNNGGFEAPGVTHNLGWNIFSSGTSGLEWNVVWANDPTSFGGLVIPQTAYLELQKTGKVENIPSSEGSQHAELDTDWDGPDGTVSGEPANVTISQTFETINGAHYAVSYVERCRPADNHNPCTLQFDWTGASSETTAGVLGSWNLYTFDREATGSSTTISFTGTGVADSYGALIDDVIVMETSRPPIPAPEFPTMALPAGLIVGIFGVILFIQKTKEN